MELMIFPRSYPNSRKSSQPITLIHADCITQQKWFRIRGCKQLTINENLTTLSVLNYLECGILYEVTDNKGIYTPCQEQYSEMETAVSN